MLSPQLAAIHAMNCSNGCEIGAPDCNSCGINVANLDSFGCKQYLGSGCSSIVAIFWGFQAAGTVNIVKYMCNIFHEKAFSMSYCPSLHTASLAVLRSQHMRVRSPQREDDATLVSCLSSLHNGVKSEAVGAWTTNNSLRGAILACWLQPI